VPKVEVVSVPKAEEVCQKLRKYKKVCQKLRSMPKVLRNVLIAIFSVQMQFFNTNTFLVCITNFWCKFCCLLVGVMSPYGRSIGVFLVSST